MTTKELIARLQELDPSGELIVTEQRYSDDGPMDVGSWSLEQFYVQNNGEWYTLTDYRNKGAGSKRIDAVHYHGN